MLFGPGLGCTTGGKQTERARGVMGGCAQSGLRSCSWVSMLRCKCAHNILSTKSSSHCVSHSPANVKHTVHNASMASLYFNLCVNVKPEELQSNSTNTGLTRLWVERLCRTNMCCSLMVTRGRPCHAQCVGDGHEPWARATVGKCLETYQETRFSKGRCGNVRVHECVREEWADELPERSLKLKADTGCRETHRQVGLTPHL